MVRDANPRTGNSEFRQKVVGGIVAPPRRLLIGLA